MLRAIAFLGIAVFATPVCMLASPPAAYDSLWGKADYVVEKLADGDVDSVAFMLHYPGSYSTRELASETANIKEGLEFILAKLGTLEGFERCSTGAVWYEMALSAGDVSYWDSLSPLNTFDVMYAGKFSKFGRGVVSISFFETESGMDLRTVVFRLDPSIPKARETLIDIYVELIRRQAKAAGRPVPENLRELVSASVPDLTGKSEPPRKQPSQ